MWIPHKSSMGNLASRPSRSQTIVSGHQKIHAEQFWDAAIRDFPLAVQTPSLVSLANQAFQVGDVQLLAQFHKLATEQKQLAMFQPEPVALASIAPPQPAYDPMMMQQMMLMQMMAMQGQRSPQPVHVTVSPNIYTHGGRADLRTSTQSTPQSQSQGYGYSYDSAENGGRTFVVILFAFIFSAIVLGR